VLGLARGLESEWPYYEASSVTTLWRERVGLMENFNFEVESGGMGRGKVRYGSYGTLR
jgi:hypothetical protein